MNNKDYKNPPRPQIIVSLTSFPERIHTVHKAIESLYNQTMPADMIVLWLAVPQFPELDADLPDSLLALQEKGLEIRWCDEDLRSHKKYFYVMQENPDAIVITADDDLLYEPYMIEALYTSYLYYPDAVSTIRTHLILPDDNGNIAAYSAWEQEFSGIVGCPSMQLFSTSGAGTLYPPHCMDKAAFDKEKIRQLVPYADDIWLKIMQVLKGTPTVLVYPNQKLQYIPGTQDSGLYKVNVYDNKNQQQMEAILAIFDTDNYIVDSIMADGYTAESSHTDVAVMLSNRFDMLGDDCKIDYMSSLEKEKTVYIKENKKLKDRISHRDDYNKLLLQQRADRDAKIKELSESKAKYAENNEKLKQQIEKNKQYIADLNRQKDALNDKYNQFKQQHDNETLFSLLSRWIKRMIKRVKNDK